ncbi:MAG: inositol 2-dehydrogenase [Acidimicrobiales bacterium]
MSPSSATTGAAIATSAAASAAPVTGDRAPVRVGVVGAGRIGTLHAELLASRVNGATLVAVADARPELGADLAGRLGVAQLSTADLVRDPGVDAVAICASTDTHVELIIDAAAAGKAIFCEKPISLDLAEVDRALGAVEHAGVALFVGFNRRFDPSHHRVHETVRDGGIGDAYLARITSRDPEPPPVEYARVSGGIFLDMTIHDFDMARYVVGSEVVEVSAYGAVRIDPAFAELGDVDTAAVTLRHDSGCITVIDNCRQASYGYDQRVEVLGSTGLAASGNPLAHTAFVLDSSGTSAAALPHFFLERYAASYREEWEAFVAALATGAAMPVSGADGRAALVVGLAAKRSVAQHRPVLVQEIEGRTS